MSQSTYLKGQLIAHIFRSGTFTKPAGLFVALYNDGVELVGGGYARVQHGPDDLKWRDQVGGNGVTSNIGEVAFPEPSGAWGSFNQFKVLDAVSGGNALIEGNLGSTKTVNAGDPAPSFADGTLVGTFV